MTWWLEAGEDGSDRIDLMAGGYLVLANGFDIVEDQEYPDQYQQLFIPLMIKGTGANDLFNKRRAILTKLRQAEQGRQPAAGAPWVNIAIQFGDADTLVRWYVVSGSLSRGSLNAIPSHTLGAMEEPALLQLRVLKGGLGEAIEYGPFTVTGDDLTFHIDGVPGDEPALAEFRITDNSDGVVVNRLRWACRSLPDMDAGDFDAVLPFNETDESVADTFTGGIETINASSTWQTIGSVSKAASAYTGGLFDAWARVRDETEVLTAPTNVDHITGSGIFRRQSNGEAINDESSTSINLAVDTLPGSLLVLLVATRGTSVFSTTAPTIETPSGWTAGPTVASGGLFGNYGGVRSAVFYLANADARAQSEYVTVNFSGPAAGRVQLIEYYGAATSSPLDVSSTSTTPGETGTTSSMSQNYGMAVALFNADDADAPDPTPSAPTGWSNIYGRFGVRTADKVVTSGGTQSASTNGFDTNANLIVVFKAAVTEEPAAGTLDPGTYPIRVAAIDAAGRTSVASEQHLASLLITGSLVISWSASDGAVDHYRVYIFDNNWEYIDTSGTETSLTISSGTSDGFEDPPTTSTVTPGSFRVRIGPESGNTHDLVSGPLYATVANSEWEPLYLGRTYLSPSESPLIASQTGWKLDVQGRADTPTQMDVDALVLMPADEQQMDVRYAPGNLSATRTWVVGTTPDMRSYGFLRDGSANEVGRLLAVGRALLGPGDCTVAMIPTVEGGIWNVDDVELSVTVYVRPRYGWLAGGV